MSVFRPISSSQSAAQNPVPSADPRLRATPDYGTFGPSSDTGFSGSDPISRPRPARLRPEVLAIGMGIFLAGLVALIGNPYTRSRFTDLFPKNHEPVSPALARDSRELDRLKPQKQAEALLELAVEKSDGAADQISSRVDGWQGKLEWNSQIATLSAAALNSNDMRVRESGIEVELTAYGLAKNSASLEYLLKCADSSDHAQKTWALWALGLMGNRGVETARVVQVLAAHLKDSDEDSRRWAVEGLALAGTAEAMPILLQTMHDDPSPNVRERAACSIAESGMFTSEQRASVIPQLLNYSDDPSLDSQTHSWAFEALADITHQRLPNDSAAWRAWYENRK